jgi:hypothetical protein
MRNILPFLCFAQNVLNDLRLRLHIGIALQIHSGRVSQQYIYWLEEYD